MTEKDLRAILSRNIRRFRAYRKLSQAEFAKRINISVPFLSDIENGKKWVSPATLAKMADAFNIEAYELIKHETIIPEKAIGIIEKYTADIYQVFGDTLNNIQQHYINQIKNKRNK